MRILVLLLLAAGMARADDWVSADTWDARYCELLVVKGSPLKLEAEVWNTLGLNDCPQDLWQAIDADAIKAETGARAVMKNGPRHWVVSTLSTHAATRDAAPVETFAGIEMRRVGTLQIAPGMRHGASPYEPTTIQRDTRYGYSAGRPVFILDDPDGNPWVMQAYSQIVDPGLTLASLADLAGRLKLPEGWSFRTETLTADLTIQPVEGTARIVQDELQNTYDLCFGDACSYRP